MEFFLVAVVICAYTVNISAGTGYNDLKTSMVGISHAGAPSPRQLAPCKDLKKACVEWVYKGYCNNPYYNIYMTVYCRDSCRMCKRATTGGKSRRWKLVTTTSSDSDAGTIYKIVVKLYASLTSTFESYTIEGSQLHIGQADTFYLDFTNDIGDITSLKLLNSKAFMNDPWKVNSIVLTNLDSMKEYHFQDLNGLRVGSPKTIYPDYLPNCLPNPCHNGGKCIEDFTDYTCECVAGYSGKDCDVGPDGNWGSWTDWSACSATCGTGSKSRSRVCDSPAPAHGGSTCPGVDTQTDNCNLTPCPDTCKDNHSICQFWAAKGYCDGSTYTAYMERECRLACGFCRDTCKDNKSICQFWAAKGYCDGSTHMERECRLACGFCRGGH